MQRLLVTGPQEAGFAEAPDPPCPEHGLVVRATRTAISTGSEVRVYRGVAIDDEGRYIYPDVPLRYPLPNGYSMVGIVEEVGGAASGFAPGDRVFATAYHQERAAVLADQAVLLPDGVQDEQAAFLNILEVAHVALRRGATAPGETVAVVGLGVIGLAALAYCKAFGFRTVALDPAAERRTVAQAMGADLVLNPTEQDAMEAVRSFSHGRGVDLVLEAASSWEAMRTGLEIVRPDGRVVAVSRHTAAPGFNPLGGDYLGKRITLLTSYGHPPAGHRWDRRRSVALTLDLLTGRRLPLAPVITHRFPRRVLPEVYRQLAQGDRSLVGVVMEWA